MKETVILVNTNGMGNAGQTTVQFQQKLIGEYLELLLMNNSLPAAICFYTSGIYLTGEGSPVLEQLQALENKGVRLIIDSASLEYNKDPRKVKVGTIGGMTDILEAQTIAAKVITL